MGHGATMHGPNPLVNLPPRRGADAEGVPASARALGQVIGMHDPKMGWSAYSQSMAVPHLMSSVVLLRATEPAARLAAWLGVGAPQDRRDADAALTDELLMPAYDEVTRAGASFRVLPSACFAARGVGARVVEAARAFESVPDARRSDPGNGGYKASLGAFSAAGEDPNAILTSETFDDARRVVTRDGPVNADFSIENAEGNCAAIETRARVGPTRARASFCRRARWAVAGGVRQVPRLVRRGVARGEPEAAGAGGGVQLEHPVHARAVPGRRRGGEHHQRRGRRAGRENRAVVRRRGAPYYHRELKSLTGSTDNHATSGLKFRVLHEFLSVGASVLLSDVDVVWMRNPFGGARAFARARRVARRRVGRRAPSTGTRTWRA